jgi:hypothetical protein
MSAKVFYLAHEQARKLCAEFALRQCPDGWKVKFSEPVKKREQEERYHAMIDDISKQTTYAGKSWKPLHMKRILLDEFADEMRNAGTPLHGDSMVIPSENGRRVIQLEIHSSEFYVKEASNFIEFLFAWGAARDVMWSDDARKV